MWGGRRLALGNAVLMRVIGVSTDAADEQSERLRRTGQTIVFLAIDARLVRILAIGDPLKESTPAALQKELKQRRLTATRVRSVKNSSLLRDARSFALRTPQLSSPWSRDLLQRATSGWHRPPKADI
jgi:hypothetical protein